jgi:hypothetical protein
MEKLYFYISYTSIVSSTDLIIDLKKDVQKMYVYHVWYFVWGNVRNYIIIILQLFHNIDVIVFFNQYSLIFFF